MSFGPMNIIVPNEPTKPWTKRDTWLAVAYGICSAATITAALTLPRLAEAPHPPAAHPAAVTHSAPQR